MSNPFLAEIRIFPFNFAPKGWAFCNGQLIPISQNTALFSLVGTYYGGDGKSNFALPNLQGCVPVSSGQSTTGSVYSLGESLGSDTITLLQSEIPVHSHNVEAFGHQGTTGVPANNPLANSSTDIYQTATTGLRPMSFNALAPAGGDQPHNNLMPYLVFNFCIALQGVFPSRG